MAASLLACAAATVLLIPALPLAAGSAAAGIAPLTLQLALPSAKQLEFQTRHEKGCFFHFGINTFTGQEHGAAPSIAAALRRLRC
jgi:hypothetical protein